MPSERSGPVTSISYTTADQIVVRGRDLCRELIGGIGFTAYFHLLVTGQDATPQQVRFLDAVLVAIAEHGFVPSVVSSRMTLAADPANLHGAVAAGLLGCGSVVLGTSEVAGRLIEAGLSEMAETGETAEQVAVRAVAAHADVKRRLPGFGHPVHQAADPRAMRLLALAEEEGVAGAAIGYARALDAGVRARFGSKLPMNVSLAIPAVMIDLGFPAAAMKGIPLLARTASLIAHVVEEAKSPTGFQLADRAERAVTYRG